MKWGYKGERDLFVARLCFEMLCRCEGTQEVKKIRNHFKDVKSPLINYIDILCDLI